MKYPNEFDGFVTGLLLMGLLALTLEIARQILCLKAY